MAARRKKPKLTELSPQPDPRAPLSGGQLLKAAKPSLKQLSDDLLERADASRAITQALKARHAQEKQAERTADAYPEWRRQFTVQVAAAWFLSCVFVRTLEDRGLLGRARLAGEGASDSQKGFFALGPSLNERDYLYFVFRELTQLPAAEDLFDARHNPVWLLAPSAESAKALVGFFRTPTAGAPAFRFGGEDTRFLGDLYQDLSEDVRKRYALLQTPRFVEQFILDRTLDRALERFGLEDTNLLDPTCGSGHFLLGAFERLLERRLQAEPGVDVRQAALKALDAVAGADINPYAVAIARFRLTLAYLDKAKFARLKDAPKLPLHVAVADSLLHNPHLAQTSLGDLDGTVAAAWKGTEFALEDPAAARDVLHRKYAAVVGNPPYITVKDKVLRDRYRLMYSAAYREYSLAVPFTQRFFQAARERGFVGMISANSFMKREFGKKVIEEYLPTVDLDTIVNTGGAHIPGHGTPTVLLFGSAQPPTGQDLLAVLAVQGEPGIPDQPEQGQVWRSIEQHWCDEGFENDFISVVRADRASLHKHPWSLAGGGATELKELLEARAEKRLGDVADSIGFVCITRADEIYFVPRSALRRAGVSEEYIIENVEGDVIRDWAVSPPNTTLFPYERDLTVTEDATVKRFLWPYRSVLWLRREPNGNHLELGLTWWEWSRFLRARYRAPLKIAFAFVATHNHFVLQRRGRAFKQSAPVITLQDSASESDYLALLAYLNSSTACFWMKQVLTPKGSTAVNRNHPDPARATYEHAGTALAALPIPLISSDVKEQLAELARVALEAMEERWNALRPDWWSSCVASDTALRCRLEERWTVATHERQKALAAQEEIDWLIYRAFGLVPESLPVPSDRPRALARGQRPFEIVKGRRSFVREGGSAITWQDADMPEPHGELEPALDEVLGARATSITELRQLALLEDYVHKRLWRDTAQNERESEYRSGHDRKQLLEFVVEGLESKVAARRCVTSPRAILAGRRSDVEAVAMAQVARTTAGAEEALVGALLSEHAVPFLDAYAYTATGLEKRAAWRHVWDDQRREDQGCPGVQPAVPPTYSQGSRGSSSDFRRTSYWRLRGKLDVPKERFISYPGCESDEDHEPIYGWAGWDHLQRAVALAELYQQRKLEEGWPKERLQPMLAGLLELLPWLKQWHNEPSEELDGARPSEQFAQFIDAECVEHGFTHDDLRSWRPPEKRKARRAKRES